jgi:hypothetical protein
MRTLLRRKLCAPLAIALLLGLAALSLFLSTGAGGPERTIGGDAKTIVSPPSAESAVPHSEGGEAVTTPARSPVEPSVGVAPQDLLATDMATVTGRCVDEGDQPLRGCIVAIERVTTDGGVRVVPETRVEPATLAGAVTVGGHVPTSATVVVRAAGSDAVAAEVGFDGRGEWHASGLVPGRYDVTLRVGREAHPIADGVRVASAASLRVDRQL